MAQAKRAVVHLTGVDSGWPVASSAEPAPRKPGTGVDGQPKAVSVAGNAIVAAEEVQRIVQSGGAAATTWTLTFSGQGPTTGLSLTATAAQVLAALEALSNIAPGDISVVGSDGGPYDVRFLEAGAHGDANVGEMTADGVGVNEVQTLTITGTPTGGSFRLKYGAETTDPIAYNAAAAAVDSALEALSNIGAGDVTCGGGALPGTPVTITFTGALAEQNVGLISVESPAFTGGTAPAASIAETTPGKAGPTVTISTQATGSAA